MLEQFIFKLHNSEFNVNVSQLPFWALSALYTWRCIKRDKSKDFILLGVFIGLGFLSKYIFIYLIIGIKLLFFYLLLNKKIKSYNFLIVGPIALIIIFPHLVWLVKNDFVTLSYGFQRTGSESGLINHILFPAVFY